MHAPQPIFQPQQDVFGAEELTVCHVGFMPSRLVLDTVSAISTRLSQSGSGAIRLAPGKPPRV
jgi:hypothetical protein